MKTSQVAITGVVIALLTDRDKEWLDKYGRVTLLIDVWPDGTATRHTPKLENDPALEAAHTDGRPV